MVHKIMLMHINNEINIYHYGIDRNAFWKMVNQYLVLKFGKFLI